MTVLTTLRVARVFQWLRGQTINCLEFNGSRLAFPKSGLRELHIANLKSHCFVKHGLFFHTLIIPLLENDSIAVFGVPRQSADNFANLVNSSWKEYFRSQFAVIRGDFEKIANVLEILVQPSHYPAASDLNGMYIMAEKLIGKLPKPMPQGLLSSKDIKLIRTVENFVKNAEAIRNKSIEAYEKNELEVSKELFDKIDKNPLTIEQRTAVVTDENATQVLASAGSGKTAVIVAKAVHLIVRKVRKPREILLLAFGKKASEEMLNRIVNSSGHSVKSRTFHGLGYEIIQAVEGSKPSIAVWATDYIKLLELLKNILNSCILSDPEVRRTALAWFSEHMVPYRNEWDFKSKCEYYEYVSNNNLRTLNGELVKSHEELTIANWLFCNGIDYVYEPEYQHTLPSNNKKKYHPDFRLTQSGVYIEHFGVRKEVNAAGETVLVTAPFVNRAEYLKGMEWKRGVHRDFGTKLVETYSYEKVDGILLESLERKLYSLGIVARPIPDEQVLDVITKLGAVDRFSEIMATFLKHFKNIGSSMDDCIAKAEKLKDGAREFAFLKIFAAVYREYQHKLGDQIDFEDMVQRATGHVESGRYQSPYRHILVDEFQDISVGRNRFLQALRSQHQDSRVFAVGDDWQSIFRFAGSDINLMQNFKGHFGRQFAGRKTHRKVDLGRTFRCVDQITYVAREFILKNSQQIEKIVKPVHTSDLPAIVIVYYQKENSKFKLVQKLREISNSLAEEEITSVLLLGRYNYLKPKNYEQLRADFPELRIQFMSVHASKGLEADHVILLNVNGGDFPSEITDDPILELVLPTGEHFPHAEERRLFYVALTRARSTVTILTHELNPSCFVEELINQPEYDVHVVNKNNTQIVKCPNCGGSTIQFLGKDGKIYYRCLFEKMCDTVIPACNSCGTNVPTLNSQGAYSCSCGATYYTCTECNSGWLIERTSKYGKFLGCVKFPGCSGKKNLKKKKRNRNAGNR